MEMTKEEYRTIIQDVVEEVMDKKHSCLFNPEELQVLKDFISFGNMFKKGVLRSLAMGTIFALFLGAYITYMTIKN